MNEIYNLLIDMLPIPAAYSEINTGKFIRINKHFCKMTGYSEEEILGHTSVKMWRCIAERDRFINQLISEGNVTEQEFSVVHKDGTIRDGVISAKKLDDDTFMSFAVDVTDQRTSYNKYKNLYANMPSGCNYHKMIYDGSGTPIDYVFLEQNAASINVLGDIVGRTYREVFSHDDSDPDFVKIYGTVALTGKSINFHQYVKTLNRWFSITAYSSEKDYFVAIFEDITEQKNIEVLSKKTHDTLIAAERISMMGYYEYDIETESWTGSDELHNIFGTEPGVTYSKHDWLDMMSPPDKEMMGAYLLDDVIANQIPFDKIYQIRNKKTKNKHWVHGYGSIENNILFGIIQDVTVLIDKDLQIKRASQLEAVGLLAGGIAHDFNNILNIIKGNVEILNIKIGDAKQKFGVVSADELSKKLNVILKSSNRAIHLTKQILAFSRKQVLKPTVLNLNDILISDKELTRGVIRENIDVVYILAKKLHNVFADKKEIQNVILNILLNARDAITSDGIIQIVTKNILINNKYLTNNPLRIISPGKYVLLSITDNGCGIDDENLNKIYDPFFTTKDVKRGTGLGLSTVYGMIKQSGGYIYATSKVNVGTVFEIFLPITGKLMEAVEVNTEIVNRNTSSYKIVIVEDETDLTDLLYEILIAEGHDVLAVNSGQQAIKLIKKLNYVPDVLLTDVVMPKMNGKQLATVLLKKFPTLKIIYMSGYTDNVIVKHGVLDKGTNFIQKPFNVQQLLTIIDNHRKGKI